MRPQLLFAVSLATLVVALSAHAGNVVVVNSAASDALQLGVDAALDGDVVLVHPGSFGAVTVAGKGVTIAANAPGSVQIASLTISSLSAVQTCVVSGVVVTSFALPENAGVRVLQCDGPVRLNDVNATIPTPTLPSTTVATAVHLSGCDDVVLSRCTAQGGMPFFGQFSPPPSGVGLRVIDSRVALWNSTIRGGAGRSGVWFQPPTVAFPAEPGAIGIQCSGASQLFASGCTIRGGNGGSGVPALCFGSSPTSPGSGAGGASAIVTGTAQTHLSNCTVSAGVGGPGGGCAWCPPLPQPPPGCSGGSGGTPAAILGAIVQLPAAGALLTTSGLAREGNALSLSVTGSPGHVVSLVISPSTRHELFLPLGGTLHYGTGTRRLVVGVIPGTGVLDASLPVGALPAGVDAMQRHVQLLTRPVGGVGTVGSPAVLTILDPQF